MSNKEVHENTTDTSEAIKYFKDSVFKGGQWIPELIKSMSFWTLEEETYNSQHNKYLIDGEAFDWLLLAKRLLDEVGDLVPVTEKNRLLLSEDISDLLSHDEFKKLLGPEKYSAYLNYWYGIVVEEAVIRNAEEEENKGHPRSGKIGKAQIKQKAYQTLYGLDQEELYNNFLSEKGYHKTPTFNVSTVKEFTYWLFKHRLVSSEGERVASDTRKGLLLLNRIAYKNHK
jgi:hypothetical protein